MMRHIHQEYLMLCAGGVRGWDEECYPLYIYCVYRYTVYGYKCTHAMKFDPCRRFGVFHTLSYTHTSVIKRFEGGRVAV